MAFPPKDKAPKPDLAVTIGTDDDAPEMEAPEEDAGLPTSSKAAAAKAFYTAGQEGDWEAAAEALGQFIDSHDDEFSEEPEAPEGESPAPFGL